MVTNQPLSTSKASREDESAEVAAEVLQARPADPAAASAPSPAVGPGSLLDSSGPILPSPSTGKAFRRWSRSQCRQYRKLEAVLGYWLVKNYSVHWVTLTGTRGSERKDLSRHYQVLLKRIEREYGEKPRYFKVVTNEGPQGVIHCFWAFRPALVAPMFIPHEWLSAQWSEIHGAPIVWIRRVGGRGNDSQRVAKYSISQYATGGQGTSYVRGDWSQELGLPGPIAPILRSTRRKLRDAAWPLPWQASWREVHATVRELLLHGVAECRDRRLVLWNGEVDWL